MTTKQKKITIKELFQELHPQLKVKQNYGKVVFPTG